MRTVRAKFRCDAVLDEYVSMAPVYSDDPNSENKKFTDATPAGTFAMRVTNPETASFFEPGQEYYLDITKAPAA